MIFRRFRTLSLHHDYVASIVPESWDVMQVVQTIQTDLPKIRFTELGLYLANPFQNNLHNVYNMQKEHVFSSFIK